MIPVMHERWLDLIGRCARCSCTGTLYTIGYQRVTSQLFWISAKRYVAQAEHNL